MIDRQPLLFVLLFASAQFSQAASDVWVDLNVGADWLGQPDYSAAPDDSLVQQADARFNLLSYPSENLELGVQYGVEQRWHLQGEASTIDTGSADLRVADLDAELIESDDLAVYQNLDRLYGQLFSPVGDITLGRQAIGFGLGKRFSPVDVVQPAGLRATERRYRPGVDAARWLIPAGAVSEIDLGWVFGEDELLFARGYRQLGGASLELTALTLNQEQQLVGFGLQTSAGNWGLWQETAWLGDDDEDGWRLALGADQRPWADIYLMAEYHYNGLGAKSADGYGALNDSAFYRSGLVLPWGQHYLSLQASRAFGALYQAQLGSDINLEDGSLLGTASLVRSLGNNTDLTLAASWPLGEAPQSVDDDLNYRSEFGVYPRQISVNWSTVF